jgi:hypothetical protein
MDVFRQTEIRAEARKLLVRLWDKRSELWSTPPNEMEFVRQAPEIIIRDVLCLSLEKPEEIGRGTITGFSSSASQVEIAGYIDREVRKIAVAQKFQLEWRRFTTAHEIGHWILHPEIVSHRDRPLMGGERANIKRPPKEREADLFGAELLMPSKLLRKMFNSSFGGPLDGSKPDEDLAFRLSASSGRSISACELAGREPMYRALLVAKAGTFITRSFVPMHQLFKVSPTAMAIQLLDLGLVK